MSSLVFMFIKPIVCHGGVTEDETGLREWEEGMKV